MSRRRAGLSIALAALGLTACGGATADVVGGPMDEARAHTGGADVRSVALSLPAPRRPRAPEGYRAPRDAIHVSDALQLKTALHDNRQSFIVLAPGRYRSSEPFLNPGGNRLYASRLGAAVLEAGISMGGNSGPGGGVLRGLVFDVRNSSATADDAAVSVWGTGRDTRLEDLVLRGNGRIGSGVVARQPSGLIVRRIRASDFVDYGVLADANEPARGALARPALLRDIAVTGVQHARPGSSDGRAEACLWVGNTARVSRVRASRCGVTGLWTGTATRDARFSDVDVHQAPVGVYIEHTTRHSVFSRVRVTSSVEIGLVAEWADPRSGGPASIDNTVTHSSFDSALVGAYLDAGTTRTTIRHSRFRGQRWGAIGDYRGRGNAYYDNDYRGIGPGAQPVRHDRLDREG